MRWSETEFLAKTEGMAMRRIGYKRFRRNLAVAAGNSKGGAEVLEGLAVMQQTADAFLNEHIDWAVVRLQSVF